VTNISLLHFDLFDLVISAWLSADSSCLERPLFLFIEEHLEIPASTALEEFRWYLTLALLLSFLSEGPDQLPNRRLLTQSRSDGWPAQCRFCELRQLGQVHHCCGASSWFVFYSSIGWLSVDTPCFAIVGFCVGNGLWVVGCFITSYWAGSNVAMLHGNEFAYSFVLLVHVAFPFGSTYYEFGSALLGIIGWILGIRESFSFCVNRYA